MRPISKVVVHCSATPDFQDVGFKEINAWHLEKGWKGPSGIGSGYHYIIRRNGTVEVGRMPDEAGAHVQGANFDSVGVCLIGTHEFNESQIKSLRRVILSLLAMFPGSKVYEHRQFPSAKKQGKTCPNMDVGAVLGITLGVV